MPRVLNLGSITALPSGKQITPNEKIGFSVVWRYLLQRPKPRLPLSLGLCMGKILVSPDAFLLKKIFPNGNRFIVFADYKINCACCKKKNKQKLKQKNNAGNTEK